MPINQGYQVINGIKKGFYQYGEQKKYYYEVGNEGSRSAALDKAKAQRKAIKASENSR